MGSPARAAIINADDLGFAAGVTDGIVRAHREGVVTSASLVANMPDAARAADIVRDLPQLGVGVHLNVSQGPPLSAGGRRLAGPDGLMNRTAAGVIALAARTTWALDAMSEEFDAQIRWAMDHGICPTHLDSHRHAHALGAVFVRVADLARRYHVRFVRRLREDLPGRWPAAPAKQVRVRRVCNVLDWFNVAWAPSLLPTTGVWGLSHTGAIDSAWLELAAQRLPEGVTEIMTHPGLPAGLEGGATRLIESRRRELAALCDPKVREAFERRGVKLVHYGNIELG